MLNQVANYLERLISCLWTICNFHDCSTCLLGFLHTEQYDDIEFDLTTPATKLLFCRTRSCPSVCFQVKSVFCPNGFFRAAMMEFLRPPSFCSMTYQLTVQYEWEKKVISNDWWPQDQDKAKSLNLPTTSTKTVIPSKKTKPIGFLRSPICRKKNISTTRLPAST